MKKPVSQLKIQFIREQLNQFPENILDNHLLRLDNDYFMQFDIIEIKRHLETIKKLTLESLVHVLVEQKSKNVYILTIVAFDFPGLFSIISGLLAVYGFSILSGKIFTYKKYNKEILNLKNSGYVIQRKKIIDYLEIYQPDPEIIDKNFFQDFLLQLNRCLNLIKEKKYEVVRSQLVKRIGSYLSQRPGQKETRLLPVSIDFDILDQYTVLYIKGTDTNGFLFSLSYALALKGINIHKLFIQTKNNQVDDTIYITDKYDRPLTRTEYLDKLRIAIALIKQFTFLLPLATDFDLALHQFDLFIDNLMQNESVDISLNLADISNETTLSSLVKIFGAGKYFWEEFVRMQYTNLLPLLKNINEFKKQKNKNQMQAELQNLLKNKRKYEKRVDIVNDFKDKELFRIDISHLIYKVRTFYDFARELTDLAEIIISTLADVNYLNLCQEYGPPQANDTNNTDCGYCLLALGKFGGRELGYASDLEVVLVYENNGFTGNEDNPVTNNEFFNILVQKLTKSVRAKDAGIFELDWRLRPYGNKGQLSCSLNKWQEYYSNKGKALDYEKQALIKLRTISGSASMTKVIMDIRDKLLYGPEPVSIKHTMELRRKQLETLIKPGKINAKYSRGGLVDLEYAVQFMQIIQGKNYPGIRQPNTIDALDNLLEYSLLSPSEYEKLYNCYAFLRRLINTLRMAKGNARDLIIPEHGSDEMLFLAQRLGYVDKSDLNATDQFESDLNNTLQTVKHFYQVKFIEKKKHILFRPGLPELLYEKEWKMEKIKQVLEQMNISDYQTCYQSLKNIYNTILDKKSFITVLVLAKRYIMASPDPDKVLINLEKYLLVNQQNALLLKQILYHPYLIELLVIIFSYSDILTNIIVKIPQIFEYISTEEYLQINKNADIYQNELLSFIKNQQSKKNGLDLYNSIRQYKNREIIRIGLRDIFLHIPLKRIVKELSDLADVIIKEIYSSVLKEYNQQELGTKQSIIALGKLGGNELNYSSDIDIVFVTENSLFLSDETDKTDDSHIKKELDRINKRVIEIITQVTEYGQLYRVDTRLRPWGNYGSLSNTINSYQNYYEKKAEGWEIQAWIKARIVAGNSELGLGIINKIHELMSEKKYANMIYTDILQLRQKMISKLEKQQIVEKEVKLGKGGIRTIEFLVQYLQIKNSYMHLDLLTGNTLNGLQLLIDYNLIMAEQHKLLVSAYCFLRKIEHRLQLLDLRQTHVLPQDKDELNRLAKRLGYSNRFHENPKTQFENDYYQLTKQVYEIWQLLFRQ